jgi:hypothetical protein
MAAADNEQDDIEKDSFDGDPAEKDLEDPDLEDLGSSASEVQEITEELVLKQNGQQEEPQDRVSINLSYCGIAKIERLEAYCNIQALYLQSNQISQIEGLEALSNLQFLALHDNAIWKLEGMKGLTKLQFLDVRDNQLSRIDFDEVPTSLLIFKVLGNPLLEPYVLEARKRLPSLARLDDDVLDDTENGASLEGDGVAEREESRELSTEATPEEICDACVTSCINRDDQFSKLAHEITAAIAQYENKSGEGLAEKGQSVVQRSVERMRESDGVHVKDSLAQFKPPARSESLTALD